jgi:hypothetical protein
MATQLNPSSSTTTLISPSSFNQQSVKNISTKSRLVFKIQSNFNQKKQFELKSSNGSPLNAVSLHDGKFFFSFYWYRLVLTLGTQIAKCKIFD